MERPALHLLGRQALDPVADQLLEQQHFPVGPVVVDAEQALEPLLARLVGDDLEHRARDDRQLVGAAAVDRAVVTVLALGEGLAAGRPGLIAAALAADVRPVRVVSVPFPCTALAALQKAGKLRQAVYHAQERTRDAFAELVSNEGMPAGQADEATRQLWAFLPAEEDNEPNEE